MEVVSAGVEEGSDFDSTDVQSHHQNQTGTNKMSNQESKIEFEVRPFTEIEKQVWHAAFGQVLDELEELSKEDSAATKNDLISPHVNPNGIKLSTHINSEAVR